MLTVGSFIIGRLFFRERMTREKYMSLALSLIGLGILYKFSLFPSQILPAISTMVAGMMGASIVVFSKKLSSRYSETQILTSVFAAMFVSNMFISIALRERFPVLVFSTPWLAQLGYTIAMLVANMLAIAGFRNLEPSIGAILGLLEVVFAAMFGVVFFQERMTIQLFVGSVCIVLAAAYVDVVTIFHRLFDRPSAPHYTHMQSEKSV